MLQAGFILLSIVLAIALITGAAHAANKAYTDAHQQKRFKVKATFVLIGWLFYVTAISLTGIFANASLPPRILLLLVIPAFALIIYFFRSGSFAAIIANTPASWPVYFQSFRIIVELLIWGSFLQGILPEQASFEGYNFDVVMGITAPLIGYFLFANGKIKNKGVVLAWNFTGFITLAIVVFVLITHAYFFSIWGLSESILTKGFGLFPFTLLAGFLMPLAVFMHIFSIIKIMRSK